MYEDISYLLAYEDGTVFRKVGIKISYLLDYEDGKDSVSKRRHIKFRRRGNTQKKNI
jgi:hypothetical protein